MKSILKLYLYIFGFFMIIFGIMNLTGILSVYDIQRYIEEVSNQSPWIIAVVIGILLASDVLFAVPTVLLVTSAGYLLGFWPGFFTSVAGMFMSGLIARLLCMIFGKKILRFVLGEDEKISEVHRLFRIFGPGVLLISRALPMLPEATCCMSGINRMSWKTFFIYYLAGTIPYAVVLVYLGSISTKNNPYPAIGGILGMYFVLWGIWFFIIKPKQTKIKD